MRAQVVLVEGNRVLLARHVCVDRVYWVLPGGEIEEGEEPRAAAVREVLEETGLEIEIERLLYVEKPGCVDGIRFKSPRHTYLGRVVGGALQQVEERGAGRVGKGYLAGAEWLAFDDPRFDAATRHTLDLVQRSLTNAGG